VRTKFPPGAQDQVGSRQLAVGPRPPLQGRLPAASRQPLGLSGLTHPHRQIYRNEYSVGIESSHRAAHAVHSIGQSADRNADGFILCMRLLLRLYKTSYPCLAQGSRCLASAPRTSAMIAMRRPKIDNLGRGVYRWVLKLGRGEFDGRPQIVHLPKP
jgi:hypothetical protein